MPNGVHDLALRITGEAIWVEATPPGTTAEGIEEIFYSVKPEKKPGGLFGKSLTDILKLAIL